MTQLIHSRRLDAQTHILNVDCKRVGQISGYPCVILFYPIVLQVIFTTFTDNVIISRFRESLKYPDILVLSFDAPLIFFNTDRFRVGVLKQIGGGNECIKYMILDASGIVSCDRMGALTLAELSEDAN